MNKKENKHYNHNFLTNHKAFVVFSPKYEWIYEKIPDYFILVEAPSGKGVGKKYKRGSVVYSKIMDNIHKWKPGIERLSQADVLISARMLKSSQGLMLSKSNSLSLMFRKDNKGFKLIARPWSGFEKKEDLAFSVKLYHGTYNIYFKNLILNGKTINEVFFKIKKVIWCSIYPNSTECNFLS